MLIVILGVITILVAPRWREYQLMRQSEPIQASLESYRQQHGQYPDSLAQVGITERIEGPLYYRRESQSSYLLWFGTRLGESLTFNSTQGKWH